VIKGSPSRATVRGLPSDWYAAATTIKRAIEHNEEDPSNQVDWATLTKNEIERAAKARKGARSQKPSEVLRKLLPKVKDVIDNSSDPSNIKVAVVTWINTHC
jgi:hypothetical protein